MCCKICESKDETKGEIKHFDIYISGSEGVWLCHDCYMEIVDYLRQRKLDHFKTKMANIKLNKYLGLITK